MTKFGVLVFVEIDLAAPLVVSGFNKLRSTCNMKVMI